MKKKNNSFSIFHHLCALRSFQLLHLHRYNSPSATIYNRHEFVRIFFLCGKRNTNEQFINILISFHVVSSAVGVAFSFYCSFSLLPFHSICYKIHIHKRMDGWMDAPSSTNLPRIGTQRLPSVAVQTIEHVLTVERKCFGPEPAPSHTIK